MTDNIDRDDHPAMRAARASWAAVEAKDRDAWLSLMAPSCRVEDPIGVAPTNPTGKGACGPEELAEFWDTNIAPNQIRFAIHDSRVAGDESAHLMTLTTTLGDGSVAEVTPIVTYRVDDEGRLLALRGFWTLDDMTFSGPDQ